MMSANNNIVIYPKCFGDSVTYLAQPITILNPPTYEIAVIQISGFLKGAKKGQTYYLCSNVSQDVFVGCRKLPALCCLHIEDEETGHVVNTINQIPVWLKVTREQIWKLRLYVCDEKADIVSVLGTQLNCTLIIKPRPCP